MSRINTNIIINGFLDPLSVIMTPNCRVLVAMRDVTLRADKGFFRQPWWINERAGSTAEFEWPVVDFDMSVAQYNRLCAGHTSCELTVMVHEQMARDAVEHDLPICDFKLSVSAAGEPMAFPSIDELIKDASDEKAAIEALGGPEKVQEARELERARREKIMNDIDRSLAVSPAL